MLPTPCSSLISFQALIIWANVYIDISFVGTYRTNINCIAIIFVVVKMKCSGYEIQMDRVYKLFRF